MDRSSSRQPDRHTSGHGASDNSSSSTSPANMELNEGGDPAQGELHLEIARLQEQLRQCQLQATVDREDWQVQLVDLESQLSVRQKLNDRQRRDIESLQEQLEQQQLELARTNRQWEEKYEHLQADLVEERDIAQKRVETTQRFKAELSLSRTSVVEAQTELSALKQDYVRERDDWAEERESLHARLAGYSETEAESIQRWQEERETRDRQEAEYREQLDAARKHLTAAQEDLVLWQQRCEVAESETESLQQQLAESQDNASTQTELAATIAALNSENQQLSEQIQHLQASSEDATAIAAEVETLRTHHDTLDTTVADLQSQLQNAEDRVVEWKRKFASLQMQHMRLKAALEPNEKGGESTPVLQADSGEPVNASVVLKPKGRDLQADNATVEAATSGADLPSFIQRP